MSSKQFRAALKTLNLTQANAAKLLGLSPRSTSGYACNENPIPKVIMLYLNQLLEQQRHDPIKTQQIIAATIKQEQTQTN